MITLHDLDEAIAECLGKRNPNADDCKKLAAFYVIKDHLYGSVEQTPANQQQYAYDAPDKNLQWREFDDFGYQSDTEFAKIASETDKDVLMSVIDELMSVLEATNPRLYRGVINKLLDT